MIIPAHPFSFILSQQLLLVQSQHSKLFLNRQIPNYINLVYR